MLASLSWNCSFLVTSGKRPLAKSEIAKAKGCVTSGLSYAGQAMTFNQENEFAWSYKTVLLKEAVTLAELEGDHAQEAAYQSQYKAAQAQAAELSDKRRAEEEKQSAKEDEERRKNESFSPEESVNFAKDLVEFKREISLDEVVQNIFMPFESEMTTLVAPVPIPEVPITEEKTRTTPTTVAAPPQKGCFREVDGTAQVQEQRAWKRFAPVDEDIVVDLPDNVCKRGDGYIAASDGVMYSISSMARPPIALEPVVINGVLNTLARTFVGFRSAGWLGGAAGHSIELKLLRKEEIAGQPGKLYSYALISCSERKENVLMIQASRAHYYTIDITGANESDVRVQRFLNSIKVK